jgi:hypothetical protein
MKRVNMNHHHALYAVRILVWVIKVCLCHVATFTILIAFCHGSKKEIHALSVDMNFLLKNNEERVSKNHLVV